MKYYAGIGSRSTPEVILELMTCIGEELAKRNWILRSGGAGGADSAFEEGAIQGMGLDSPCPEIYLPWPKFNYRPHNEGLADYVRPQEDAFKIAADFHPAWHRLSHGARCLHARNTHQIYGPNVNKPIFSEMVICWTPDGKGGGGTGQALRLARFNEIPIYDLATTDGRRFICNMLDWVYEENSE